MAVERSKVEEVFETARRCASDAEREAYLSAACGEEEELRREVESLLKACGEAGDFLKWEGATEPVETACEGPGSVVGRYKLLQKIGEGGMGMVFMAEQEKPIRRRVALKIIKPGMDSKAVIARFEAERQALGMMDHPNIARVFDGGCTETGRPYFVMELVQGIPITKYCDEKQLTPQERLGLFVQVCNAIQHAHQKGIIHRDIKPTNVLVAIYDGKPVPKVIDFGVAKALHQRLTEATMFTQFGAVVGTMEYMSPEQSEVDVVGTDTRTDVYSLGVLLYELLTGSTPIGGEGIRKKGYVEMLRMIREVEPPRPSTRLSQSGEALAGISAQRQMEPKKLQRMLAGDLDWIVMKALEKDRTRRYETAVGLAGDVERHLRNEVVVARPPSAGYRLRKWVLRNRLGLLAATGVTVTLFVGVLLSTGATVAAGLAVLITLFAGMVASTSQAVRANQACREQEKLREQAEKARAEAEVARANESKLREQAQGRFEQVRRLARVLIFDVHAKVKNLAGATPAIELMVKTAREYLESLSGVAKGDRDLLRDMAEAYEKVGEIQGNPNRSGQIGDTQGALASYTRGLAIREELVNQEPGNKEDQRSLARCLQYVGEVSCELGDAEGAMGRNERSLQILRGLIAQHPADLSLRGDLARLLRNKAEIQRMRGDPQGALASLNESAGMLFRLQVVDPEQSGADANLLGVQATVEMDRAEVFMALGRTAEALEHYRKCLSAFRKMRMKSPSDARSHRAVAVAQMAVGESLVRAGEAESAVESYLEANEILRDLATGDPVNTVVQHVLAVSCQGLGDALRATGDHGKSLEQLREAQKIFRRLVEQEPSNPYKQSAVGGVDYRMGDTLAAAGDAKGALGWYNDCLNQMKKVVEICQNTGFEQELASAHASLGRQHGKLGNHAAAGEHLREALQRMDKIVRDDPGSIFFRQTLGRVDAYMGEHLMSVGDMTGALHYYQRSFEIYRKVCAEDADQAEARGELRGVLCGLGRLCMAKAQAKACEEPAVLLREAREWFVSAQEQQKLMIGGRKETAPQAKAAREMAADLAACDAAIALAERVTNREGSGSIGGTQGN
ncbi:MAG TPA: serine/threonine-protein kinase [Phycisphaerae bacterium]|nr:serine/threonine-protein kinase [Phycisphaerae bacterium]